MTTSLSLQQWCAEELPREKFLQQGRSQLSDAELLAILLRSGSKVHNAVDLARQILASVNHDLHQLAKLTLHDFCTFDGMGPVKALSIMAALELGRRRLSTASPQKLMLSNSSQVYTYMKPHFLDLPHEEFWLLCLNNRSQLLYKTCLSVGGFDATPVCIRKLMHHVLHHKASSVIVLHNHPSGILQASEADKAITLRISIALNIFQVTLSDHIIMTDQGYFSFRDQDLLE